MGGCGGVGACVRVCGWWGDGGGWVGVCACACACACVCVCVCVCVRGVRCAVHACMSVWVHCVGVSECIVCLHACANTGNLGLQ